MLWRVANATQDDRSSRRRRAGYAAYRARRVFWHALIREGAAWHAAFVVVGLTIAALVLVRLTSHQPGMPDAVVYEVTKGLWSDKTRAALDAGHAKGKIIRKENALAGAGIPVHAGAERFYKEAGLIKA